MTKVMNPNFKVSKRRGGTIPSVIDMDDLRMLIILLENGATNISDFHKMMTLSPRSRTLHTKRLEAFGLINVNRLAEDHLMKYAILTKPGHVIASTLYYLKDRL